MKRFWVGFIAGIFFGAVTAGTAAVVAGDNGYMMGWEIKKDGEKICSDPYIWTEIKEIECD